MEEGAAAFTVRGKVQGKQRPRFTRAGRCYTPKATADYEAAIAAAFRDQCGWFYAASEPVAVSVGVFRALPKSRPKSVAAEADTARPDLDNVVKVVLDALNGLAYADDAQVVEIHATKHDRMRGACEFVQVMIWRKNDA